MNEFHRQLRAKVLACEEAEAAAENRLDEEGEDLKRRLDKIFEELFGDCDESEDDDDFDD